MIIIVLFIVLAVILAIFEGIYLYFFIGRTLEFYGIVRNKKIKIISSIICVLLAVLCINIFGMPAMIVLHFIAVSILLDILNILFKKYPIWKKIRGCGILPIIFVTMIIGYGYYNMNNVVQTEYTVYTDKKIDKNGYKLALITDLHYGTTMGSSKLEKYCDKISKKNVDMVLLGGDIVDERTSYKNMTKALRILGGIKSRYGIFYVYGNHDKNTYRKNPNYSVKVLDDNLVKNNIHILRDETVKIDQMLYLTGRVDAGYSRINSIGRKSGKQLIKNTDKSSFKIVLDHQPVELKNNDECGYDLQLSGHTHGGQIWPVGLITDILGFGELNYGYKKYKNMQAIVSSGMAGWGYSIRTGAHSEYVIVNIRRRQK